jgi:hypothetical protein
MWFLCSVCGLVFNSFGFKTSQNPVGKHKTAFQPFRGNSVHFTKLPETHNNNVWVKHVSNVWGLLQLQFLDDIVCLWQVLAPWRTSSKF